MTNDRVLSVFDEVIVQADKAVRTLLGTIETTDRDYPAQDCPDASLSENERRHAAGLMRVNYAGEVSAQALYQGQAVTARLDEVREEMEQAALEENDHLAWCGKRLEELGSRPSFLNPFWYLGSFMIGAIAGIAGDEWSLGFVAETEEQVGRHLDSHLEKLPDSDERSKAILEQMREDELAHRDKALAAGGRELPDLCKDAMALISKIMTKTAYYF